jgi:hypothetical protein
VCSVRERDAREFLAASALVLGLVLAVEGRVDLPVDGAKYS